MTAVPLKPVQARCRRCETLFCYFQRNARRFYCGPCVETDRLELLAFSKVQRRERSVVRAQQRTISLIRRLETRAA